MTSLYLLAAAGCSPEHHLNACCSLQLLESFDAVASLRIMLSEILYARCTNPLDFWLKALPCLPQSQVRLKLLCLSGDTSMAQ